MNILASRWQDFAQIKEVDEPVAPSLFGCAHPLRFIKEVITPSYAVQLEFIEYDLEGKYSRSGYYGRRNRQYSMGFVHANALSKAKVEQYVNSLSRGYELGLVCKADLYFEAHHIPVIDFISENKEECREVLARLAAKHSASNETIKYRLYSSGRSFHGYLGKMITDRMWRLNWLIDLRREPTVDQDWIQHSLERGYSVLRWSNQRKPPILRV